ncbi:hypothetical protein HPB49_010792 [Dermacentor silvarum]|uniref:Uncharacterized protein n=1 Tax=Dermacentor silvarum TaxID=543639 RepID=A0ACB8DCE4_DERSI|nr:hypothetical protein HPB49_010792 [Dermacentor silvarum]
MAWSTVPQAGEPNSAPSDQLRNENLLRRAESRFQRRNAKMTAGATSTSGKSTQPQHGPVSRAAKDRQPKSSWKPKPLPKFPPDDFVVIIKPRTAVAIGTVFQYDELGLSLRGYLSAQMAAELSFVFSSEQNILIASTKNAYAAGRLLSDFVIKSVQRDVPLRGHLKQNGEEICYGVITVANQEQRKR